MKVDALLGCVRGLTSMSVTTFQVVLVYNLHIHGTSSYNIHCNMTRDNFQNNHEDKKNQITHDSQQRNKYINKQNDHHTFIYSRQHLPTT